MGKAGTGIKNHAVKAEYEIKAPASTGAVYGGNGGSRVVLKGCDQEPPKPCVGSATLGVESRNFLKVCAGEKDSRVVRVHDEWSSWFEIGDFFEDLEKEGEVFDRQDRVVDFDAGYTVNFA